MLYDLLPKTPNEDKIMRLLLVMYSYRAQVTFLFFFYIRSFYDGEPPHFLIGFSPQSLSLPFFLFVCHSLYINTICVLDVFSESLLITSIQRYGHPGISPNCPYLPSSNAVFFFKVKCFFYSSFFPNICY